jgi:hypothetical protein
MLGSSVIARESANLASGCRREATHRLAIGVGNQTNIIDWHSFQIDATVAELTIWPASRLQSAIDLNIYVRPLKRRISLTRARTSRDG